MKERKNDLTVENSDNAQISENTNDINDYYDLEEEIKKWTGNDVRNDPDSQYEVYDDQKLYSYEEDANYHDFRK